MKTQMQGSSVNDRRHFLKKAVYAAPVIIALGSLTTASAKGKDTAPGQIKKNGSKIL